MGLLRPWPLDPLDAGSIPYAPNERGSQKGVRGLSSKPTCERDWEAFKTKH